MHDGRDVRRCALQALYQFDSGGAESPEVVRDTLVDSPGGEAARGRGFDLATMAWEFRSDADEAVAELTPEWPLARQPVVDRNLLRLAYYEVVHGEVPPKIAINEAVELAKEFSTERSASFVNGVLDRLFRARLEARS